MKTIKQIAKVFILAIMVGVWGIGSAFSKDIVVNKIRFGQHGDMTRIVLESNKPLKSKHFLLPEPPRYVLDFPEVEFTADMEHLKFPPGSLIEGVRQGLFKPGVTRFVVDLEKASVATVFTIPPSKGVGFRLVIDLRPATDDQISKRKEELKKEAAKQPTQAIITSAKKSAPVVVVIDPGHGGVDPGAIGRGKTYEKNITLQIAKRLQREMNKMSGVKAYLTRDKDIYVKLSDRVRYAQAKGADLFISLHADAHRSRKVKGGSVYILSDQASDKEAARLARDANRGDLVAGLNLSHESADVRNILIDLTQRETMNKSAYLAKEVLKELDDVIRLRKERVLFAGFRVLKAPDIPSVLVEMSYLSNPGEEKMLKSRNSQEKIARSLARGLQAYITQHVHK